MIPPCTNPPHYFFLFKRHIHDIPGINIKIMPKALPNITNASKISLDQIGKFFGNIAITTFQVKITLGLIGICLIDIFSYYIYIRSRNTTVTIKDIPDEESAPETAYTSDKKPEIDDCEFLDCYKYIQVTPQDDKKMEEQDQDDASQIPTMKSEIPQDKVIKNEPPVSQLEPVQITLYTFEDCNYENLTRTQDQCEALDYIIPTISKGMANAGIFSIQLQSKGKLLDGMHPFKHLEYVVVNHKESFQTIYKMYSWNPIRSSYLTKGLAKALENRANENRLEYSDHIEKFSEATRKAEQQIRKLCTDHDWEGLFKYLAE